MINKLDNPVWYSLSESHQKFSIDYGDVKFYQPDYCPFGAFINTNRTAGPIDKYAELKDIFFVVGEKPSFFDKVILKNELVCLQMIIEKNIILQNNQDIIALNGKYEKELFDLVDLVQPGYFNSKTVMLGEYYGIFDNGKLVAVTGERMKMDGFTEVSAVVTHPDYTGKGFAKQLVAHTVKKIIGENKIPYLHVAERNSGAIKLYETLGFSTRRKISFWNFIKA
ncbi:MAG: GNAT family N-acetyltransferase [Chitinophagaceae bacterium]